MQISAGLRNTRDRVRLKAQPGTIRFSSLACELRPLLWRTDTKRQSSLVFTFAFAKLTFASSIARSFYSYLRLKIRTQQQGLHLRNEKQMWPS